jgi:hypothetical protein
VSASSTISSFLPKGAPITWERIDQGQDFRTKPGGFLDAIGDGYVSVAPSDPGGFGTHYPLLHITSGPLAGKTVYYGHTRALVTGPVKAGSPIAVTGVGGSSFAGNAKAIPCHAEIGFWPPGGMSAGSNISDLLHGAVSGGGGGGGVLGAIGGVAGDVAGAVGDAAGAVGGVAGDVASAPVDLFKAGFQWLWDQVAGSALKFGLYATFILGGMVVAGEGVARLFGTVNPVTTAARGTARLAGEAAQARVAAK